MESSSLGVRTRSTTLALQRLQSSSSSTPPPSLPSASDSCYLQLRSRRLHKPPTPIPCPNSHPHSASVGSVDEISFPDNNLHFQHTHRYKSTFPQLILLFILVGFFFNFWKGNLSSVWSCKSICCFCLKGKRPLSTFGVGVAFVGKHFYCAFSVFMKEKKKRFRLSLTIEEHHAFKMHFLTWLESQVYFKMFALSVLLSYRSRKWWILGFVSFIPLPLLLPLHVVSCLLLFVASLLCVLVYVVALSSSVYLLSCGLITFKKNTFLTC